MIEEFNGFCMKHAEEEIKLVSKKEFSSVSELINELLGEKINERV